MSDRKSEFKAFDLSNIIDNSEGCSMIGVGGFHSDSYGDDGSGACIWCGKAPSLAEQKEFEKDLL